MLIHAYRRHTCVCTCACILEFPSGTRNLEHYHSPTASLQERGSLNRPNSMVQLVVVCYSWVCPDSKVIHIITSCCHRSYVYWSIPFLPMYVSCSLVHVLHTCSYINTYTYNAMQVCVCVCIRLLVYCCVSVSMHRFVHIYHMHSCNCICISLYLRTPTNMYAYIYTHTFITRLLFICIMTSIPICVETFTFILMPMIILCLYSYLMPPVYVSVCISFYVSYGSYT